MVEAVILLAVALTIVLLMFIILAIMYFRLSNLVTRFINTQNAIDKTNNEVDRELLIAVDSLNDYFLKLVPDIKEITEQCNEVLKVASNKAQHSRDTMQNARKLLNAVNDLLPEGKEKFKWEEKEESEEEPRS